MSNKRVFDVPELTTPPDNNDFINVIDISDLTESGDGTLKKIKIENLIPVEDYSLVVYVNNNNPNAATIFDDVTPPVTNDNAFKSNVDNLYIGLDSSVWIWNGTSYATKTNKNNSNFFISGTSADAGANKASAISRTGTIKATKFISDGKTASDIVLGTGETSTLKTINGIEILGSGNIIISDVDISGKVDKNTTITGATKTKVTYDSKGLVTSGADATTADIASSTDKRYQTDLQQNRNDATSSIQTQLDAKKSLIQTIETAPSATYTLSLATFDQDTIFTSAVAVAFTVPTNASVAVPIGKSKRFTVQGAGTVTLNGAGITFVGNNLVFATGETFTIYHDETNTWSVEGNLQPSVSDTAYDATSWDGVTTVAPSKNAVRDKIESLTTSPLSKIDEGSGYGIVVENRNPLNYGIVGPNAIDLSYSDSASSTKGATQSKAFACGYNTTASGQSSFASGSGTTASGNNSFASGSDTTASGNKSFACGYNTTASGNNSFASGSGTTASGNNSFASGDGGVASGDFSFIGGGEATTAKSYAEVTIGRLNTNYTPLGVTTYNFLDRAFGVGNGTSNAARSDALILYKNGLLTLPSVTNALITAEPTGKAIVTKEYLNTGYVEKGVDNSTTVVLTSATLNSTYPNATTGFRVYCASIIVGAMTYEKTPSGWLGFTCIVP